jgi:hypothetical protein
MRGSGKMRWPFILAAYATLTAGSLHAGEQPAYDPLLNDLGYRGEFVRTGAALSCVVGKLGPKVKPEDAGKMGYQPCMFIGEIDAPFVIGADAKFYLERIGMPDKATPDTAGSTSYVYPLAPGRTPPFMVLTVLNDRVAAFQISGQRGLNDFPLNQVTLGSPAAKVIERFGEPMQTKDMPDGKTMWSYLPWPISFVIADDKVVSMRIANQQLR